MEHRTRILGAGLLLLLLAFASEALTLGRVRGAALIGKPLDMVVPVQMDSGESASSLCVDVDVFHADTRQDASRVRVLVEAAAQPGMANVRVLSSAVVDEPVVTLYLRAGCGQKTTRRYVLLADLPSEVAAPSVPLVVAASAPANANQVLAATASAAPVVAPDASINAKAVPAAKPSAPRAVANTRPVSKAAVASPKGKASDGASAVVRPVGQSRLRLDPLELLSDRVSNLDAYMTFAPPPDALDSMQKIQTLEGSVKSLVALAAKNEASLADLRARLQTAESNRLPLSAGYALIALALVCLTAVVLLWNRQRQGQITGDWRGGSLASTALESDHGSLAAGRDQDNETPWVKSRPVSPTNEPKPSPGVDVNLTEMSDSNFHEFMPPDAKLDMGRRESLSSVPVVTPPSLPVRHFNPDTAIDVRQQAAFHVSLGQTDRAVQILKGEISESDQPDPFVYLDLLGLLHSLGLTSGFQHVRDAFNQRFGGRVGEFAAFKNEGLGLESYPDVLSHITALWPAPQVVAWIEAAIFRNSQDDHSHGFDLAAFRDLLMLHGVALNLAVTSPPERRHTTRPGQTARETSDFSSQEANPFLALDLDLSGPDGGDQVASASSASEVNFQLLTPIDPEVDAQKRIG